MEADAELSGLSGFPSPMTFLYYFMLRRLSRLHIRMCNVGR